MKNVDEENVNKTFVEFKNTNTEKVLEELYKKYYRLVYSIAFSILKNKEDSEDVVQAIFIKIYNMPKENLPSNNTMSWLYTVTKNESISLLRKKKNTIELENIYEIENKNNEINEIIDQEEFNRLISKLTDKEKEIVSLKVLSNLSFDEIAKLLNEPTGTVKWRYYKSIYKLKILLSNLGMSIIAFILGLKTLLNKEKIENIASIQKEDNNNNEVYLGDETKSITQEIEYSERNDNLDVLQEETNTVVVERPKQNVNYFGITCIAVSIVFLIVAIIFCIKNQLKLKKKTSKL